MFRIVILDGDERVSRSVLDATTGPILSSAPTARVIRCRDQHLTASTSRNCAASSRRRRAKNASKEPANA